MKASLPDIQTLFKSWFVDFDPTRAKIAAKKRWLAIHDVVETSSPVCYAGEFETHNQSLSDAITEAAMVVVSGKSLTELEQLDPDQLKQLTALTDLFPDVLTESGLGELPQGWTMGLAGDLFELQRGFDLPEKDRHRGVYPVFSAEGYDGQHDAFKMTSPGIITGCSGVIGRVHLTLENYWPLNTTLYVREFKKCGPFYAYCYLSHCGLKSIAAGSEDAILNSSAIHSLPCYIPDRKLLNDFESIADRLGRKSPPDWMIK
jgi:type I restriction enzyme S subunit